MLREIRHALGLVLLVGLYSHAQSTTHGASSDADTIPSISTKIVTGISSVPIQTNGTCLSRTVNYITHTLPQQCLRTDRAAPSVTQNAGSPDLSHATHTPGPGPSDSGLLPLQELSTASSVANTTSIQVVVATPSAEPSITGHSVDNASEVGSIVLADGESDAESPLDNAKFLSFEEWKKQNLAKAGQSPENVGQDRSQMMAAERRRPGINNALEGLGEEHEIDLDFSGFGGVPPPSIPNAGESFTSPDGAEPSTSGPGSLTGRSKDAGKTCKERTNYASFDCAATVLKTNTECKSASSVLVEHKDSYMLNICSAKNKFFIVELCNDILVDTIVLANYEFFSSSFRHFRVSVTDRYPVKLDKWRNLGTFEAHNTREVQAFLVKEPLIWARYLRIESLSHYGNEYYCPISLLRVHGTTMMQEFRNQEELAQGEMTDEDLILEDEVMPVAPIPQEPVSATDETGKSTVQCITELSTTELPASLDNSIDVPSTPSTQPSASTSLLAPAGINTSTTSIDVLSNVTTISSSPTSTSTVSSASIPSSPAIERHEHHAGETDQVPPSSDTFKNPVDSATSTVSQQPIISAALGLLNVTSNSTSNSIDPPGTASSSPSTAVSPDTQQNISTVVESSDKSATSATTNSSTASATLQNTASMASSTPPLPQPSTQESFFKSIHKRLQQLESNSTLSLQYIEEQSRILRDAFGKVEKRQLASTASFLFNLNSTVMTELHGFRQAYDQLWQSTVIELDSQREQSHRELLALSSRLTLVADELVWQKRMGIVQSTLLLLCLGLVLFARHGTGGAFELPLVQHMATKPAPRSTADWESEPNSPSPDDSRSPVSLFRRRILGAATPHAASGTRLHIRGGLDVQIEPPPSPDATSQRSASGDEGVHEDDVDVALETQSEPPTPNETYEIAKRPPSWPGESGEVVSSPLRQDPMIDDT